MANLKHMDDDYVRKSLTPSGANVRDDAGMFIVRYNPQDSLAGTTPSCQYNVGVNEKDNIASALRKNARDIQALMDDWFGIEESDKSQRVFVSHQEKIDDEHAYCTVVYAGYESENEGEVSALLSDQISHVIDKRIPMTWNDEVYPVTDAQVEQEQIKEAARKEVDAQYVGDMQAKPVAKTVTLNESLASREPSKEAAEEKGMDLPWN